MKKAVFVKYDEMPEASPHEDVYFKPMMGDNVGFTIIRFTKGVELPTDHEHADEQMGYCLKGKVEWIVRDDSGEWTETLTPGMAYLFPPHTYHGLRALEDSEFIEVYCPPERHRDVAKKLGLSLSETK